jgi:hypothetical protein
MLLGPAVLIVLRVYLQIYVEHSERWDRLARSMSIMRAPTLGPLQHPLIRYFGGLIFYLLLPLTMLLFAWKAAVFPAWGAGLLGVAAAVVASHLMLPLRKFSWPSKALLSTGAAIVVAALIVGVGPVRRPFALFRANLSGQWLVEEDLRGANLSFANLTGANLLGANLSDAQLSAANLTNTNLVRADVSGAVLDNANLSNAALAYANLINANLINANLTAASLHGANLSGASLLIYTKLTRADLTGANLTGANLLRADMNGADLSNADLSDARDLTQEQLDQACGNADTKLSEGLTLKRMCQR